MTTAELQDFRATVTAALESAGIEIAHSPFAVVCAERPAKGGRRGRAYPWGMALSEEGAHSELPQLRAFLLTDGLLGLREAAAAHYEAYRARRLRAQRYGVGRVLRASVQLGLGALCVPKSRRWVRGRSRASASWPPQSSTGSRSCRSRSCRACACRSAAATSPSRRRRRPRGSAGSAENERGRACMLDWPR